MMFFQHASGPNRATAYDHEKPYQRLNSFVKGMLYKLDEDIDRMTSEVKMWNDAEVIAIFGDDPARGVELSQAQIHLDELHTEKKRWVAIAEKMQYCVTCNGCGQYWGHDSDGGNGTLHQCSNCKGTGVNSETVPNASVPAPKKKALPGILAALGRKFR